MPTKPYRPTSPGRRGMTVIKDKTLSKGQPEKSLTTSLPRSGGRNNFGRITTRFRGGGHKRLYRVIDFKRNKIGVPGKVVRVEYDPNRSARIALLQYEDGIKSYIIAPMGVSVWDVIGNGAMSALRPGNSRALKDIPLGTVVHNIAMRPGKGGQIARSAGTSAQILAAEDKYITLRLPSGEMRMILETCRATIGQVGNAEHANVKLGKAGRKRWLGWRPTVRGSAMDPASHPHGGGEGKSGIGMAAPKTPWGKKALGVRTRRNKRTSKFIIRRRGKRR